MQIALGQINNTVGDLRANSGENIRIRTPGGAGRSTVDRVSGIGFDGVSTARSGREGFFPERTADAVEGLARDSANLNVALVVGYVARSPKEAAIKAQNAAAVIHRGRILFDQRKMLLPTYDVFDEARYFQPAARQGIFTIGGTRIALAICEDFWNDKQFWERRRYSRDPIEELIQHGADVLISINASPWNIGKRAQRRAIFESLSQRFQLPLVYVHMVGGNDQLIFDGSSFAMTASGKIAAQAKSFAEDLILFDSDTGKGDRCAQQLKGEEGAFEALVLGTHDYIRKCGFQSVLVGLSGGIDSALVAAIAVEAVGKENVMGIGMPGPYSSEHSLTDAKCLAQRLGIRFEIVPIKLGYEAMTATLHPMFSGYNPDTTEENLQSRLRGMTLMALSNKFGSLVLTTGNKSEIAVGYCTLYGDMCGGLAVISDVPKTLVYRLGRIANARWERERHRGSDSRKHVYETAFRGAPSRPEGYRQPSRI